MRTLLLLLASLALATDAGVVIYTPGDAVPAHAFPLTKGETQHLTIAELGGRRALRVDWDAAQEKWCEFSIRGVPGLPEFQVLKVTAQVWLPAACNAAALTLRFRDEDGEIAQVGPAAAFPSAPGWHTVDYIIDTGKPMSGSWKGGESATLNRRWDGRMSFSSFAVGFKDRESKSCLGIGAVTAEVESGPCRFALETGTEIGVVRPGRERDVRLRASNVQKGGKTFISSSVRVTGMDGEKITALTLPDTMPAGGTWECPLPPPNTFGVYYVEIVSDDGAGVRTNDLRYCYMDPAGPTAAPADGEFIFGINAHPERYPAEMQRLEAVAAGLCGVKIRRTSSCWSHAERAGSTNLDFTVFDRIDGYNRANGIEPQLLIGGNPAFADTSVPPLRETYPDGKPLRHGGVRMVQIDKYSSYIEKLLEHCKGRRIRYVESWNEPDIVFFANFAMEHYIKLQQACFEACRKADPDIRVLSAGWAAYRTPGKRHSHYPDYLRDTLDATQAYFDALAFHAHGPQSGYIKQVQGMKKVLAEKGVKKPWLSNETAISATGIGELMQAATLFKKFLYAWSEGALGLCWYDLRNDGFDPADSEHNYGLITHDFYPKQAYAAYNALAKFYTGARYVRAYGMPEETQALLFKSASGDWLAPVWHTAQHAETRTFTVSVPGGRAFLIDLFGNQKALAADEAGACRIVIGDAPATVRVCGGGPPAFSWDTAAAPAVKVAVKASPAWPETPALTLGRASTVVPLMPNVPETMNYFWKNEGDLSGALFFRRDADALLMKVEVRDDIHNNGFAEPERMQDGDSVLCAFAVPGQQGSWEICFARRDGGAAAASVRLAPEGRDAAAAAKTLCVAASRDERAGKTVYEIRLPFGSLGAAAEPGAAIAVNVILNDADESELETSMHLAPGFNPGEAPGTRSGAFPQLVLE